MAKPLNHHKDLTQGQANEVTGDKVRQGSDETSLFQETPHE